MIRRNPNPQLALLAVALAALACRGGGRTDPAHADAAGKPRGEAGYDDHSVEPGPAVHAEEAKNGEAKVSDLDRPVEELFAATCEHGKRTYECDVCRYEVGVARVPARLLEEGLLKQARVSRRHIEVPIELTAEVRFDERRVTHVSPRVEGTVRSVHASLGERVRRGQPMVEIESVQLGEAEGELLAAQAALRLARSTFERHERLREERISSEREYLAARQEQEAAQIRARFSREKLARLGVASSDLDRLAATGRASGGASFVIRAPADGIVLEMHAVPGELVKPDQSIVTVGDVASVWVWADVHEDQLGRVLEAQRGGKLRAEIAVKAFPEETFRGSVDFLGPSLDERTRTVKVRVAVSNPDGKLRTGMFAAVRIQLPGQEDALAVPRAALLSDEGRSFVFVHHHGDYWVRRPVEPGREWADWVELKAGLSGGETVATDGSFLLKSDVLRSKMGAGCAD